MLESGVKKIKEAKEGIARGTSGEVFLKGTLTDISRDRISRTVCIDLTVINDNC